MWAILRRLLMVLVFGIASFAVTLFVGMSFATAVRTESVRIRRKFVALTLGCAVVIVVIVVVTVSVVVVEASSTAATIWTASTSAKGVEGILTGTEIGGIRVGCEDFGFRSIRGSSGRCR